MTEHSHFDLLTARIDRLERQSKVLKRLLLGSFAAVLALLAGGATLAQQKQIVFSNVNGSIRVGSSGFGLYDTSGKRRLMLGWNSANQPGIYLIDGSGTYRMGLFLSTTAKPVIRLYDSGGTERASFTENAEGTNMIEFFDSNHVQRAYFGQSTADEPMAEFFDTSHTLRAYIGQYTGGNFGAYVNDSAGTTTWQTP